MNGRFSYRRTILKSPGSWMLVVVMSAFMFTAPVKAQLIPLLGGQRAGISSLQFLKLGAGARAAGMGEAFVAVADDASALYYNPAGLTQFEGNEIMFTHTTWLIDLEHEFLGAVYRLSADDAVGVSFVSLHTDDMEVTTETQPFGTGRYFSYSDVALALSYSRELTNQFSFGVTIRYVEETIDVLKTRAFLMDIGTYYWTGLGSTRFSVTVTNFGSNVSPEGTFTRPSGDDVTSFQDFSPPTMFKIGFAFEAIENEYNRLTTSVQLNHPNDNSENLAFGLEYAWNSMVYLRSGYHINVDEKGLTAGAGVQLPVGSGTVGVDYAFSDFGRLGNVHRLSIKLGL